MRKLLFLLLILPSFVNAQYGYCFDDSYMEYEEMDSITNIWFEDVQPCPYGNSWHEVIVYCHDQSKLQKFTLDIGDTLKIMLGKELVVIAASIRHTKGNTVYGTSYPNICITGINDIDCFEEYIEPVIVPIGSFTIESNCIQTNMDAGLVMWNILDNMTISVEDIQQNTPYCLNSNTCYYLVFQDGTSTSIYCL